MDSIIASEVAFLQGLLTSMILEYRFEGASFDVRTIDSRVRAEGLSFLTKTLPKFQRHIDACCASGRYTVFPGFRSHRDSVLPVFLYGALKHIFEDSGLLKSQPSAVAFAFLRQVNLLSYKLEQPFSDDQLRNAIKKFREVDSQCMNVSYTDRDIRDLRNFVSTLFESYTMSQFRHGPGITNGIKSNHDKWFGPVQWYANLDSVVPYEWSFPYYPVRRKPRLSGENKVLFVPKDSRGPRTIACEPREYMWYQQAFARSMMDQVSRYPFINFVDQGINRSLALQGSVDGSWSTIDLQDASDSVPYPLVKAIFPFGDSLMKCRTPVSLLPDGSKVYLNKYAAMGSALCFPVESVVFSAILFKFEREAGIRRSFVYGDDIAIQTKDLAGLSDWFRRFGVRVNLDKSFTAGPFRESCGGEYFHGVDVKPLRVRRLSLLSLVSYANSLYERGLHKSAEYIIENIPTKYGALDLIFRHPRTARGRWNSLLHREEIRVLRSSSKQKKLRDYEAYVRWLHTRQGEVFDFRASVVAESAQLKFSWGPRSAANA